MTGHRRVYLNVSRVLFDLSPPERDGEISALAHALDGGARSVGRVPPGAGGARRWRRASPTVYYGVASATNAPMASTSAHT